MDLNVLIDDLRNAADNLRKNLNNGKPLSTIYCHKVVKVVEKVSNWNADYESIITGLWVIIAHFTETLDVLVRVASFKEAATRLFRECAKAVLNIQWQNLEEDSDVRQKFVASLANLNAKLVPLDYQRFRLLESLLENPWTDPTLAKIMGGEAEDEEEKEEVRTYIAREDAIILQLRVDMMLKENCEEYALNLCNSCLLHPELKRDLTLRKTQLSLLHKLGHRDKLQEECQNLSVQEAVNVIRQLQTKSTKEICTVLAQTFMVQHWIRQKDHKANKDLLRLWIRQQQIADKEQDRFKESVWAIAKLSQSTEQILFFIDILREQCGKAYLQLYVDMCIFAINVDKGQMETSVKQGQAEVVKARKEDMSAICGKLACLNHYASIKVARICVLTAFVLKPCLETFQAIIKFYSQNYNCCITCNKSSHGNDHGIVNPATLYEVERLLNMLRPEYLNPDNSLSNIKILCERFCKENNLNISLSTSVPKPPPDNNAQQLRMLQIEAYGKPKATSTKPSNVFEAVAPSSVSNTQTVQRGKIQILQSPHQRPPVTGSQGYSVHVSSAPHSHPNILLSGSRHPSPPASHQMKGNVARQPSLTPNQLQSSVSQSSSSGKTSSTQGKAVAAQAKSPTKLNPQLIQYIQSAIRQNSSVVQELLKHHDKEIVRTVMNMLNQAGKSVVGANNSKSLQRQQPSSTTPSSADQSRLPTVSTLMRPPHNVGPQGQQPTMQQQQPSTAGLGGALYQSSKAYSHPMNNQAMQSSLSANSSPAYLQTAESFRKAKIQAGNIRSVVQSSLLHKQQVISRQMSGSTVMVNQSSSGLPLISQSAQSRSTQNLHHNSSHMSTNVQSHSTHNNPNTSRPSHHNLQHHQLQLQSSSQSNALPQQPALSSDELSGSIMGIDDKIITELLKDAGIFSNTFPDIEVDFTLEDLDKRKDGQKSSATHGSQHYDQVTEVAGRAFMSSSNIAHNQLSSTDIKNSNISSSSTSKLYKITPISTVAPNHNLGQPSKVHISRPWAPKGAIAQSQPQMSVEQIREVMKKEQIDGEVTMDSSNNATYRCIICSLAFKELEELREHVRNVCKPGLQSSSVYNTKIKQDHANSAKAGLETTTVFQCLRCFELCISQEGIKKHRLTCKRVPTVPPDIKNATLNNSKVNKTPPASRSATPKMSFSQSQAKATVTETKPGVTESVTSRSQEKPLSSTFPSSNTKGVKHPMQVISGAQYKSNEAVTVCKAPMSIVETKQPNVDFGHSKVGSNSSNSKNMSDTIKEEDVKVEPEEKNIVIDKPEGTIVHEKLEQADIPQKSEKDVPPQKQEKTVPPHEQEKTSSPHKQEKTGPSHEQEKVVPPQKQEKAVPPLTPSNYSEISGSGGRKFYRCKNCSQILCSYESLLSHWKDCATKPPVVPFRNQQYPLDPDDELEPGEIRPLVGNVLQNVLDVIAAVARGETGEMPDIDSDVEDLDFLLDQGFFGGSSPAHTLPVSKKGYPLQDVNSSNSSGHSSVRKISCLPMTKKDSVGKGVLKEKNDDVNTPRVASTIAASRINKSLRHLNNDDSNGTNEEDNESEGEIDNDDGEARPALRDRTKLKPIQSFIKESFVSPFTRSGVQKSSSVPLSMKTSNMKDSQLEEDQSSNESEKGDFKCIVCSKMCYSKRILIQHYAGKHLQPYTMKTLTDGSSYFCHLCQKSFSTFMHYMHHVPNHGNAIMKKMNSQYSSVTQAKKHCSRRIAASRGFTISSGVKKGGISPKRAQALISKKKATKSARERMKKALSKGTLKSASLSPNSKTKPLILSKQKIKRSRTSRKSAQRSLHKKVLKRKIKSNRSSFSDNIALSETEDSCASSSPYVSDVSDDDEYRASFSLDSDSTINEPPRTRNRSKLIRCVDTPLSNKNINRGAFKIGPASSFYPELNIHACSVRIQRLTQDEIEKFSNSNEKKVLPKEVPLPATHMKENEAKLTAVSKSNEMKETEVQESTEPQTVVDLTLSPNENVMAPEEKKPLNPMANFQSSFESYIKEIKDCPSHRPNHKARGNKSHHKSSESCGEGDQSPDVKEAIAVLIDADDKPVLSSGSLGQKEAHSNDAVLRENDIISSVRKRRCSVNLGLKVDVDQLKSSEIRLQNAPETRLHDVEDKIAIEGEGPKSQSSLSPKYNGQHKETAPKERNLKSPVLQTCAVVLERSEIVAQKIGHSPKSIKIASDCNSSKVIMGSDTTISNESKVFNERLENSLEPSNSSSCENKFEQCLQKNDVTTDSSSGSERSNSAPARVKDRLVPLFMKMKDILKRSSLSNPKSTNVKFEKKCVSETKGTCSPSHECNDDELGTNTSVNSIKEVLNDCGKDIATVKSASEENVSMSTELVKENTGVEVCPEDDVNTSFVKQSIDSKGKKECTEAKKNEAEAVGIDIGGIFISNEEEEVKVDQMGKGSPISVQDIQTINELDVMSKQSEDLQNSEDSAKRDVTLSVEDRIDGQEEVADDIFPELEGSKHEKNAEEVDLISNNYEEESEKMSSSGCVEVNNEMSLSDSGAQMKENNNSDGVSVSGDISEGVNLDEPIVHYTGMNQVIEGQSLEKIHESERPAKIGDSNSVVESLPESKEHFNLNITPVMNPDTPVEITLGQSIEWKDSSPISHGTDTVQCTEIGTISFQQVEESCSVSSDSGLDQEVLLVETEKERSCKKVLDSSLSCDVRNRNNGREMDDKDVPMKTALNGVMNNDEDNAVTNNSNCCTKDVDKVMSLDKCTSSDNGQGDLKGKNGDIPGCDMPQHLHEVNKAVDSSDLRLDARLSEHSSESTNAMDGVSFQSLETEEFVCKENAIVSEKEEGNVFVHRPPCKGEEVLSQVVGEENEGETVSEHSFQIDRNHELILDSAETAKLAVPVAHGCGSTEVTTAKDENSIIGNDAISYDTQDPKQVDLISEYSEGACVEVIGDETEHFGVDIKNSDRTITIRNESESNSEEIKVPECTKEDVNEIEPNMEDMKASECSMEDVKEIDPNGEEIEAPETAIEDDKETEPDSEETKAEESAVEDNKETEPDSEESAMEDDKEVDPNSGERKPPESALEDDKQEMDPNKEETEYTMESDKKKEGVLEDIDLAYDGKLDDQMDKTNELSPCVNFTGEDAEFPEDKSVVETAEEKEDNLCEDENRIVDCEFSDNLKKQTEYNANVIEKSKEEEMVSKDRDETMTETDEREKMKLFDLVKITRESKSDEPGHNKDVMTTEQFQETKGEEGTSADNSVDFEDRTEESLSVEYGNVSAIVKVVNQAEGGDKNIVEKDASKGCDGLGEDLAVMTHFGETDGIPDGTAAYNNECKASEQKETCAEFDEALDRSYESDIDLLDVGQSSDSDEEMVVKVSYSCESVDSQPTSKMDSQSKQREQNVDTSKNSCVMESEGNKEMSTTGEDNEMSMDDDDKVNTSGTVQISSGDEALKDTDSKDMKADADASKTPVHVDVEHHHADITSSDRDGSKIDEISCEARGEELMTTNKSLVESRRIVEELDIGVGHNDDLEKRGQNELNDFVSDNCSEYTEKNDVEELEKQAEGEAEEFGEKSPTERTEPSEKDETVDLVRPKAMERIGLVVSDEEANTAKNMELVQERDTCGAIISIQNEHILFEGGNVSPEAVESQGSVGIRFDVDQSTRVIDSEVVTDSRDGKALVESFQYEDKSCSDSPEIDAEYSKGHYEQVGEINKKNENNPDHNDEMTDKTMDDVQPVAGKKEGKEMKASCESDRENAKAFVPTFAKPCDAETSSVAKIKAINNKEEEKTWLERNQELSIEHQSESVSFTSEQEARENSKSSYKVGLSLEVDTRQEKFEVNHDFVDSQVTKSDPCPQPEESQESKNGQRELDENADNEKEGNNERQFTNEQSKGSCLDYASDDGVQDSPVTTERIYKPVEGVRTDAVVMDAKNQDNQQIFELEIVKRVDSEQEIASLVGDDIDVRNRDQQFEENEEMKSGSQGQYTSESKEDNTKAVEEHIDEINAMQNGDSSLNKDSDFLETSADCPKASVGRGRNAPISKSRSAETVGGLRKSPKQLRARKRVYYGHNSVLKLPDDYAHVTKDDILLSTTVTDSKTTHRDKKVKQEEKAAGEDVEKRTQRKRGRPRKVLVSGGAEAGSISSCSSEKRRENLIEKTRVTSNKIGVVQFSDNEQVKTEKDENNEKSCEDIQNKSAQSLENNIACPETEKEKSVEKAIESQFEIHWEGKDKVLDCQGSNEEEADLETRRANKAQEALLKIDRIDTKDLNKRKESSIVEISEENELDHEDRVTDKELKARKVIRNMVIRKRRSSALNKSLRRKRMTNSDERDDQEIDKEELEEIIDEGKNDVVKVKIDEDPSKGKDERDQGIPVMKGNVHDSGNDDEDDLSDYTLVVEEDKSCFQSYSNPFISPTRKKRRVSSTSSSALHTDVSHKLADKGKETPVMEEKVNPESEGTKDSSQPLSEISAVKEQVKNKPQEIEKVVPKKMTWLERKREAFKKKKREESKPFTWDLEENMGSPERDFSSSTSKTDLSCDEASRQRLCEDQNVRGVNSSAQPQEDGNPLPIADSEMKDKMLQPFSNQGSNNKRSSRKRLSSPTSQTLAKVRKKLKSVSTSTVASPLSPSCRESPVTSTPKKRGRPKKSLSATSLDINSSVSEEKLNESPRFINIDDDITFNSRSLSPSFASENTPTIETNSIGKKRGRPRKRPIVDSESSPQIKQVVVSDPVSPTNVCDPKLKKAGLIPVSKAPTPTANTQSPVIRKDAVSPSLSPSSSFSSDTGGNFPSHQNYANKETSPVLSKVGLPNQKFAKNSNVFEKAAVNSPSCPWPSKGKSSLSGSSSNSLVGTPISRKDQLHKDTKSSRENNEAMSTAAVVKRRNPTTVRKHFDFQNPVKRKQINSPKTTVYKVDLLPKSASSQSLTPEQFEKERTVHTPLPPGVTHVKQQKSGGSETKWKIAKEMKPTKVKAKQRRAPVSFKRT